MITVKICIGNYINLLTGLIGLAIFKAQTYALIAEMVIFLQINKQMDWVW